MTAITLIRRIAARAALVAVSVAAVGGPAYSQSVGPGTKPAAAKKKAPAPAALTESQTQAMAILTKMTEFVSAAQRFSVGVSAAYDALQQSGQKIEFGENRKVTLARPDRLRVEGERSDGAKTTTVFSGKEITLIDAAHNVYATTPQPGGVDESIVHFVRDLGMKLPLAVLLVSRLTEEMKQRVQTVDYVEKTTIRGVPAHHLAARADTVDFQIWIADGDKPLPQRVVITYRNAKGEPQFRADFSDWNLAPAITDATFAAKAPAGAQKVAFAAQLPRVVPGKRKPSAEKDGGK